MADAGTGTETAWQILHDVLEEERREVAREIGAYPRPVAGCDAQFNHLLARRSALAEQLRLLGEIAPGDLPALREFLGTCRCVAEEAARRAEALLAERCSESACGDE